MAHIALAATSITPWEQAECPVAFVDMDAIPVEYQDDVNGVAALGLMTGTGTNQFAPQKEVTRAEACTVLCRLHQMGNIDTNALAPSEIQNMKIVFESKAVEENSYPYRKVLAKLPVELLELFTDKGWTLVFVADTATRYPQYSDAVGVTDAARRQICIEVESSLFLSDVQTVAHEFGHFLKYCTGSAINSKNNVAYQAEKDDLAALVHSNYCKQDPDEFFAEAFMASICYGSTAMEKAPQAYDVVMLALDTVFGDEM